MKILYKTIIVILLAGCVNTVFARKANVVILATGGTIAGAGSSATDKAYVPGTLKIEDVIKSVPGIDKLANISGEQFCNIASQNMTSELIVKLACRVNQLLATDKIDGVVITHGTDTLEETAYFLNLTVKSDKPVVITGSMRPSTAMSADGPLNLYNAVAIAASESSKSQGVLVALNDMINGARAVTKTNTIEVQTFRPREYGALGHVHVGHVKYYRKPLRKHTSASEFAVAENAKLPKVVIIYGYFGINADDVRGAIGKDVQGVVYAGVGDGNPSTDALKALIEARKKGIVIVRSSRCGSGEVLRDGEFNDTKHDFISADNLNPQKARILLMLALMKTNDTKKLQQFFYEY